MRSFALSDSTPSPLWKSALLVALAAAALWAADADAREGRHGGGSRGWSGPGQWQGGPGHRWQGGGHRWSGGHRAFHPGWAVGLGVGVGLTYPWWGGWGHPYGYPYGYYVERVERPVGVVLDVEPPPVYDSPPYRWYCPSPPGYHPDVKECSQGWLKVLPEGAQPHSPPPR